MKSLAVPTATCRELDCLLAFSCAPVMAGLKPVNIVSLKKPLAYSLEDALARIAPPLGHREVYFFRLAECDKRVLLAVYRRGLLQKTLQAPQSAALLEGYGYPTGGTAGQMLRHLSLRIRRCNGFPHEIGVFLGYPPGDVERFIRHKGRDYKLCGYWKVYENVEEAKRIFSVYDQARDHFCQGVANGEEIYNITYGGTVV